MDREKYGRSGYVSFRIRDPDLFKKGRMRIPKWLRRVASSVSEGAYIVQGQLKTSGAWRTQSIRIKAGNKSDSTLHKEAGEIARKICACEDKESEIAKCRHENYLERKK